LQTSEQEDCKQKLLVGLIRRIARDETYIVLDEHLENFEHKKRLDGDLKSKRGLSFLDSEPAVKPISEPRRAHKRVYRRKTRQEIASRCRMLAAEIRRRGPEVARQHENETGFRCHTDTLSLTGKQAVHGKGRSPTAFSAAPGKALDLSMLPSTHSWKESYGRLARDE
jgi:hypothetical protein